MGFELSYLSLTLLYEYQARFAKSVEHELSIEASRLNVSLSDYILKVLTLRRDWLVLEEMEDAEDVADAEMALQEDGFIPLADAKRELGLS